MESAQLLVSLSNAKKKVVAMTSAMQEISRLEGDRPANIAKIQKRLVEIEEFARGLDEIVQCRTSILEWAGQFREQLSLWEAQHRRAFGSDLEKELLLVGVQLTGQYPELRAGLFTIELLFEKGKTAIWYGPKQELLGVCRLSAHEISKRLQAAKAELGSQLEGDKLVSKIKDAYSRAKADEDSELVPILRVLAELAYVLQSQKFHDDPRKENYRGYSRADFSFDLYRLQTYQPNGLFMEKPHLVVATRARTKSRRDFIWVPEDASGKGVTYSHLKF
jgi:hypothetical protein